ncbi:ribonuclease PH [Carboxydochorda subterranea]|uniref:Ribonuclease PH n=1 Tax=Carboxydichorda subterranea TaxID=3109565 RepID=A0ABZ1BZV0_9FIRM|nr:ribonuclease PH [Limnochorda sp. L945t]WRP18046.1 ribonuclease PH [Limnochorda sp. L945t]
MRPSSTPGPSSHDAGTLAGPAARPAAPERVGRAPDAMRPVRIERQVVKWAEGSALISVGDTRVLCTASVEEKVPLFLRGTGNGWVTAEYAMLPRSTRERTPRDISRGRQAGRSVEIQRLIGRSLRAVVDLTALGERTVWVDCDVLQADGGTRTAAITGGFVALADALWWLAAREGWAAIPLADFLAAVSVGIVGGEARLDLEYAEDSVADVDMNVVMTGRGQLVEVQGTAEHSPFDVAGAGRLLELAAGGIRRLVQLQRDTLSPELVAAIDKRREMGLPARPAIDE